MEHYIRQRYQPNKPLTGDRRVTGSKEHIALSERASEESIVLLKNDGDALPLKEGKRIALFGKGTIDYVKGGGGSGDVYCEYTRNIYEGFKEIKTNPVFMPLIDFYKDYVKGRYADKKVPGMFKEPAVPEELMKSAARFTDTAIISICRFSGEGWDRSVSKGEPIKTGWDFEESMTEAQAKLFPDSDFCLSSEEKALVDACEKNFKTVIIVLNAGGIIDVSWIKEDDRINAAIHAFQGGMEGGLAMARTLAGLNNPSGRLTDTYARALDDYPSSANFHESDDFVEYTDDIFVGYRYFETIPGADKKIIYPFGYGLSYSEFEEELISFTEKDGKISVKINVTNLGPFTGKYVTGLYGSAPHGKLDHEIISLMAFAKTRELKVGESEIVFMTADINSLAVFDDEGLVKKSAMVLDAGKYTFYYGINANERNTAGTVEVSEVKIIKKLHDYMAPTTLHKRLRSDGTYTELKTSEPYDINESVIGKLASGVPEGMCPLEHIQERHYLWGHEKDGLATLTSVYDGKNSVDELVNELTDEQMISILGGQPDKGVSNTFGIGNLPEYNIPTFATADGPAGVRLHDFIGIPTTAWPCATALASSFNTDIVYEVGKAGGAELKENNLSMWLTPAVNIHRNPMCGRNFEYYSEDPLIAGKMGAAMVRGIQSNRVSACVKHFAANNKETNRKESDSRLSERALREIYLRAFEIIVEEGKPWSIMDSYNAINGRRASEAKELLYGILKGEWGFDGIVVSDWWTSGEHYKEILAGTDVKMPTGYPTRVKQALEKGAIKREDMIEPVKRIINFMLRFE